MAGKKSFEQDIQERSAAREILDAAAQEMGFAVDSIRHELVEKGWFGKDAELTPDVASEWLLDGQNDPDIAQAKDYRAPEVSRDNLYGRDIHDELAREIEREQDIERQEMISPHLLHNMTRIAAMAALKIKFASQVAPMQSYIAAHLGSRAAQISGSVLTSAMAAAYLAKVQGKSEDEQMEAAASEGGTSVRREIVQWLQDNF